MSSIVVYFSDEEDKRISLYMNKWKLPKYKTVKRIINEFKEKDNES